VKLLPRRSLARSLAVLALLAVVGLLLATGWYLLWPLAVTGGALLYLRYRRPGRTAHTSPARPVPSTTDATRAPAG
jgi:amino acid efflux transporter